MGFQKSRGRLFRILACRKRRVVEHLDLASVIEIRPGVGRLIEQITHWDLKIGGDRK